MESIEVDQAIFASSDRGLMKGYQLVAKSAGVDRDCGQELCRWAPTKMNGSNLDQWTINYFPVSDGRVAVTRTILGGPEYSSRGGTQVVTLILLVEQNQFSPYANNPMALAKTAMALGWLRLPLEMRQEHIPPVQLPAHPLIPPKEAIDLQVANDPCDKVLEEALSLLEETRRVAIVGTIDPIAAVEKLIPHLSIDARRTFSFTTGLLPAIRRPFQVHFLQHADSPLRRTLTSQNIVTLDV